MSIKDTPTDSPTKQRRTRSPRKRVLGDGEGDYCIYEIVGQHPHIPKGALLPIPKVPNFEDTQSAMKWIRAEGGNLLVGKQVMVLRACELLSLRTQSKPTVVIEAKPKIAVADQTRGETSDG